MLYAVKGVGTAPADDVRTHVILYALYAYYFYRRRQEKAMYMAIHVTCTTTLQLIMTGQMMVNELAESLLAPNCLLYTSPSPRDGLLSRMPSSA